MSILDRLRGAPPPPTPVPALTDPTPTGELHTAMLAAKDRRISQLELQLATEQGRRTTAVRRAETAEQALRELSVARAGDAAAAELAHARRTLTQYEELLEGCRRHHGWNTRAGRSGTADADAPGWEIAAIKRREDV